MLCGANGCFAGQLDFLKRTSILPQAVTCVNEAEQIRLAMGNGPIPRETRDELLYEYSTWTNEESELCRELGHRPSETLISIVYTVRTPSTTPLKSMFTPRFFQAIGCVEAQSRSENKLDEVFSVPAYMRRLGEALISEDCKVKQR
jgi:hypothetical protein